MSWLARSLTNPLRPDLRYGGGSGGDDDGGDAGEGGAVKTGEDGRGEQDPPIDPEIRARGVKGDISELTKTLSRQFWGVANFLAPPPHIPSSAGSSTSDGDLQSDPAASEDVDGSEVAEFPAIAGIRSDFAEIGGRFRSGISRLSGHKAVSEFSKIASTFLPFGSEEDEEEIEESEGWFGGDAVGVTEEVLAFARNISMHPETWLDFPLLADDEDSDDFDMSDVQQEHALAVERLAPRLAALRIELCPTHMSEGCFWKIYFVLVHPRLSKHDAELLSTPQIAEARAMLLQRLQSQAKPEAEKPRVAVSYRKGDDTSVPPKEQQFTGSRDIYETTPPRTREGGTSVPFADFETEKHLILTTDTTFIDKSVIEEQPLVQLHKDLSDTSTISIQKFDDDGDDWLEDDSGEMGVPGSSAIPFENDEDVSFSDLEEEDDGNVPASSKTESKTMNSQPKDKAVLVNKSSGGSATDGNSIIQQTNEESNDWPGIDDI